MPSCMTRAYTNVNQHPSHINISPTVCLLVLNRFRFQHGGPRDKQQWQQLHMDQYLCHQGLLLTKLFTSGTPLHLGVTIRSKSFMLGDNKSVITSSTIPNSLLSKRHHISAYHRVREAIDSKYLMCLWKDGKTNPEDCLSKHWEFSQILPLLQPLLFWRGEAADIKQQTKGSDTNHNDCPSSEVR